MVRNLDKATSLGVRGALIFFAVSWIFERIKAWRESTMCARPKNRKLDWASSLDRKISVVGLVRVVQGVAKQSRGLCGAILPPWSRI